MYIGDKIIVLGCSGSGKSTFAGKLHGLTGLPLIHLDNLWWRADRTHITREEFDRRLAEALSGPRWIIDGDYSRTYAVRFRACDTVFFLDYDEQTCMRGIAERVGVVRPDIPWVAERLDPDLVQLVKNYRRDERPAIHALLREYPDRRAFVFHTRDEADRWLSSHFSDRGTVLPPWTESKQRE